METWEAALERRNDLKAYGSNKLLLFALELHQQCDDIELVASDALTDGPDDKKCDLVFINKESGKVIIAQAYWSPKPDRSAAPANKASDLNTAAAWLFTKNYSALPDSLHDAAAALDEVLDRGEVSSIEFWYVHNLPESQNVRDELCKVSKTADSLLRRNYPKLQIEAPIAVEVGRETVEAWYRGTQAPILVADKFAFNTKGGFKTEGTGWSAYSTSVPAKWPHEMFRRHGKNLFSANVRDYLGSRKSDKNINNNIKQTAEDDPGMFWVYNNGITALVNDFLHTSDGEMGLVEISGIAIVNGAQTTGALGSTENADLSNAFVPARFVKCSSAKTVQSIVRFNNSQNKIEASDFRSNDTVQARLRREFESIRDVEYFGGRRGGDDDTIGRPRNVIPSYTAGQALMAFHGEPTTAYNESSNIWQSDSLYSKVFDSRTTAKHLLLAFSLLKAVDEAKSKLRAISVTHRTEPQSRQWETFRQRGSTFLLTAAVAASLETIVARAIPDRFKLEFKGPMTIPSAIEAWSPVLRVVSPLVARISPALSGSNINNKVKVREAIEQFVDTVGAIREANGEMLKYFVDRIKFE